jgi:hypothetical protein
MIWFLGDVHGNFDHLPGLVASAAVRPSAIVFLGDLDCPAPYEQCVAGIEAQGVSTWFIPGNHDTDSRECATNLLDSEYAKVRNLHGRVVEINGIRIAGLGGVFRGEIWYPDRQGTMVCHANYDDYARQLNAIRPRRIRLAAGAEKDELIHENRLRKHLSSIFYDDWVRLGCMRADILVTHEAPDCHRHGFTAINELALSLGVHTVFHGHHHECPDYDGQTSRLGFNAYGVGFCGILDQDGKMIQPGDFDAARQRFFGVDENQRKDNK